jgi:succinate dehydrogenase / fumarate reductase, cytochrome b subunit
MNKRPVYLNLLRLHLPLPGWVSILHRVTGVLLFLALPLCLYFLQSSLGSATGFAETRTWLNRPFGSLVAWLLIASLALHVFAGLRHLALDMHWGVEKSAARHSTIFVLAASGLVAILSAGWLFL